MKFEKKLEALFEYQLFDGSERLEKLIRETENRGKFDLSDEALEFVTAAGDPEQMKAARDPFDPAN